MHTENSLNLYSHKLILRIKNRVKDNFDSIFWELLRTRMCGSLFSSLRNQLRDNLWEHIEEK